MLNERELTKKELEKREKAMMDLKTNKRSFVKRYGKDAEAVMYGRATNIAKKQAENMNKEKLRELIKTSLMSPGMDPEAGEDRYKGEQDLATAAHALDQLEAKLKAHDWYYMMSDDNRAYTNGRHEQSEIRSIMNDLEGLGYGKDAKELYNQYAPFSEGGPDFRMKEAKGKDMDKDGDVDSQDYLAARDAAIKKAKGEVKEGTWALGNAKDIQRILDMLNKLKDNAYNVVGDDDFFNGLDNAISRAEELMMNAPLEEMDINDPIAMKFRAAKDKLAKMRAANAGDDGNDKFFDDAKLRALKKKRAQIMSDMEQEAEMEGGPVADRYGDMLNKIDKAIAMLQGQGEWGPETNPYMSKDEIERRAAMIGLEEGSSTEEKRIAMSAVKRLAKYRGVSTEEAKADLLRAVKELGDLNEGTINEDKMEALMELRNILDELQVLGDQARDIIAENFPSFLRKGEAYGAFDMGSSSNRYDTTLASIVADIEEYGDEEDEDMMQEDMDLGHQDNEPHMLKADLYRIGKYAMELYQIMDDLEGQGEVDLPHWWQAKVINAKDAIVGAKHYLDFELKEPQIDAMVDVADDVEAIDEEEAGEVDMVASDIQKAMNASKGDEAKTHQLKKARIAMNKGDLEKAKKIADRIAKQLKSK